jgi:DNA-binding transcriptional LysR family regulator
MDTENLRSFLEVAAHGSFTVAASRLNLAQSTVSARIRGLEEQLGAGFLCAIAMASR